MRDIGTSLAAKLVGVAPATVSGWIDTGLLAGYRLPSRNGNMGKGTFRRVIVADLLAFCHAHGMTAAVGRLEAWGLEQAEKAA